MKDEISIDRYNRLINHGPVILVTTARKGKPNAMALAWYSPMSKEPPLIGVFLDKENYTHRLVMETGELVLNLPPRDLIREVYFCGSVSGKDVDKFAETGLHADAPSIVRPPLVRECIGHIEAEVVTSYEAGDHTLFVVKPLLCLVERALFDEVWDTTNPAARGLYHLGASFFMSGGPRVEVNLNERVDWKRF